jgi:uncharacterized Zn finger protein
MPAAANNNEAHNRSPSADPTSDRAQLSALSGTLDELARRITEIAAHYEGTTRQDLANGLYEVERSLLVASRQLAKVMRDMQ